MYNMLTSSAKFIRDGKRSYEQKLYDEFVTNISHRFYGPNYSEDAGKAWKEFKELRKKNTLQEVKELMGDI